MSKPSAHSTDPSLWTVRRVFGPAGGPDEIVLTDEGHARAFSVGAQCKLVHCAAMELLASVREGQFSARGEGARIHPTALGRFDQITWGYLREKGYAESVAPDGIRVTKGGLAAYLRGLDERRSLLDRCKLAARAA